MVLAYAKKKYRRLSATLTASLRICKQYCDGVVSDQAFEHRRVLYMSAVTRRSTCSIPGNGQNLLILDLHSDFSSSSAESLAGHS